MTCAKLVFSAESRTELDTAGADEESKGEDEIQKLTDKFVKDVDGVVKAKEDELMAL